MTTPIPQSVDSLAGRTSTAPFITIIQNRAPTPYDGINNSLQVGQRWINTAFDNQEYFLLSFIAFAGVVTANWILLSSAAGEVDYLTGNSGGPVGPDGMNNINVVGDGTTINIVGNPGTNTLTASVISGVTIDSIAGDTGTISGAAVTIYADNATQTCGSSVQFINSGTISTLNVTDTNVNTIIGASAGNLSLSGVNSTGLGFGVLSSAITVSNCIAIGFEALNASIDDTANTACGWGTMSFLNGGSYNTAVGFQSMNGSTTASNNTGIGVNSLLVVSSGANNTGLGYMAGQGITTGAFNLFLGSTAGSAYTSAETANVLLNSTGSVGESNVIRISDPVTSVNPALSCYIGGINNTNSSGFTAPLAVFVDSINGQLGYGTSGGSGITTINGDTGSITGSTVTIFAGFSTQNCGSTVEFVNSGATSTLNVTDANSNTIVGFSAGNATISGLWNTSIGSFSLQSLTSGVSNVGVGRFSLNTLTSGTGNIAVGQNAGTGVTTGTLNVMIGGGNSLTTETSNLMLYANSVGGDNNTIRIGIQGSGGGMQNLCYIAGIQGATISAGSPTPYLTLVDATNGQVVSPLPVSCMAASSAYGSLAIGTALQNTANYPILVNVSMAITAATGAVILVGVGSTSAPTAQAVTASFSTTGPQSFSFVVPSKYYAKVTTTGTITVGSITTCVTQIG